MNTIKFEGHSQTTREVIVTNDDLAEIFDLMRSEFLSHINYAEFKNDRYIGCSDARILDFCKKFGVDGEYKKDRIAFFNALLNMKNPYKNDTNNN